MQISAQPIFWRHSHTPNISVSFWRTYRFNANLTLQIAGPYSAASTASLDSRGRSQLKYGRTGTWVFNLSNGRLARLALNERGKGGRVEVKKGRAAGLANNIRMYLYILLSWECTEAWLSRLGVEHGAKKASLSSP